MDWGDLWMVLVLMFVASVDIIGFLQDGRGCNDRTLLVPFVLSEDVTM